jgi:PAS domain-containing protein
MAIRAPHVHRSVLNWARTEEEELIVFSHSRIKPGQNYQNFNNKIYLSGKSSPLIDNKGRLLVAIESLRDITEIRKAQQALMDSEEKYRNIIEEY